jgi:hypothetical protein
MHTKSEGQLQLERGISKIEKRIKRGDFNDPRAPIREFSKLLDLAITKMTASERDAIQSAQLRAHQLGTDILAEHGDVFPKTIPK